MKHDSSWPKFDNSKRAVDAVRSTARRLIVEKLYKPNRQATLINDFLFKAADSNLIAEVKPSTWIDFVREKSTRIPTDIRIINAAWLWMMVDCPHILVEEYNSNRDITDHSYRGLLDQISESGLALFSPDEIGLLTDSPFRIAYKLNTYKKIAVGTIYIWTGNHPGNLKFKIMLPRFDFLGDLSCEGFYGDVVPFHGSYLFLGSNSTSPFILVLNGPLGGMHGFEVATGHLIYHKDDRSEQHNNIMAFIDNKFDLNFYAFDSEDYGFLGPLYEKIATLVSNLEI